MSRNAKVIMVQGTMSNSGKSFLTAGLCRVFRQDGYRVAPFKSQNMALNSYITKDGLEIGRAQAMQAEAAGIEPTVDMNPILLKPTSHMGSQIIVNGQVLGNMKAVDYYANKAKLVSHVTEAYNRLAEAYDVIVIEGAGSPAEINLRENDIVNMGLARLVKAPVLLVGDIDRGGVFAALYGTVKLLEEKEQSYIKGLVINKFRGDRKILEPGLAMMEERVGIPVLGVVPMERLDIDDEDSLSDRLDQTAVGSGVDVAVVRLPHISNFTDFGAFERMDGVSLRYVRDPGRLGKPDLVILPGTKNTMDDLLWMRKTGMEAVILRLAEKKIPILGICGGFQMLGEELCDPHGVEHGGTLRGMGLLHARTVFSREKTRTQISGTLLEKAGLFQEYQETQVTGYEIHMGQTENLGGCRELIRLENNRVDALSREDGLVMGSYLHGLFDTPGMAESVIRKLMLDQGLDPADWQFDLEAHKEAEYDKLADLVRRSLDMKKIYEILEAGIQDGE
ncbi:MAG: cobyric acid synthase [Lachnospiraceae bacterium]|jgi:adenosylcobyric acid synthase|nr:cobyric acid synthase [Lachnospiraceae bacterium]